MQALSRNFQVAWVLFCRNIIVSLQTFWANLIDLLLLVVLQAIMFLYIMPSIVGSAMLANSIYIGMIVLVLQIMSYQHAFDCIFDFRYNRLFDYYYTLPISKWFLISAYVVSIVVELCYKTLIVLVFAKIILWNRFDFSLFDVPSFFLSLLVGSLFMATFFFLLPLLFSFDWFTQNIWPRVLVPMEFLGCVFFPWKQFSQLFPNLSKICLINPVVYIVESFRISIVDEKSLPLYLCLIVLICFSFGNVFGIRYALRKRHDYL